MKFDLFMIPSILTTVFCAFTLIYCYRFLSETNIKIQKKEIRLIFLIAIFFIINNLYNEVYLKAVFTIFFVFLFFKIIFKNNALKTLKISAFLFILTFLIEFLLSILLSIFVFDVNELNDSLYLKIIFSILDFWLIYLICTTKIVKEIFIKIENSLIKNNNVFMIISLIFIIANSSYIVYIANYHNYNIYFIFIITLLLIFILLHFYIKESYNNKLLLIKNKFLVENQKVYAGLLEDYKLLKHNLTNDFIFAKSLCTEEKKKLLDEKLKKYNISSDILIDINSMPKGIQGIFYVKASYAKKRGINIYFDYGQNWETEILEGKKYIDFCEVLSILFDNAIEAALKTENKVIYFNINKFENKKFVEIINSFSNSIDLDKIGDKNYSTKSRGSGFGLNYIQNLNSNIIIKHSIINDLFKTLIVIDN